MSSKTWATGSEGMPPTLNHVAHFTGEFLNPLDLGGSVLDIRSCASSLSKLPRFNGHCTDSYSVAQHSILVSQLAETAQVGSGMHGLLHDVTESCGLGDIARPLKRSLVIDCPESDGWTGGDPVSLFEKDSMLPAVIDQLGAGCDFSAATSAAVDWADQVACATEAWLFMRRPAWAAEYYADAMNIYTDRDIADSDTWPEPCRVHATCHSELGACWAFLRRYNELRSMVDHCAYCDTELGEQNTRLTHQHALCDECIRPWKERY